MSAQGAATGIRNGAADHDGQGRFFCIAEIFFYGENGCFGIQGIKDGFNQEQICTAIHQSAHLFVIGVETSSKVTARNPGLFTSGERDKGFIHRADGAGDEFLVGG